MWKAENAVTHLRNHAQAKSLGRCAQYTREAVEAGGVVMSRRTLAKNYGTSLMEVGFMAYEPTEIIEQLEGDVVIIQNCKDHPAGHMAMWDGGIWISDFRQRGLYPGADYRREQPSFKFYRYVVVPNYGPGADENY